jgi:hypothetical protein
VNKDHRKTTEKIGNNLQNEYDLHRHLRINYLKTEVILMIVRFGFRYLTDRCKLNIRLDPQLPKKESFSLSSS